MSNSLPLVKGAHHNRNHQNGNSSPSTSNEPSESKSTNPFAEEAPSMTPQPFVLDWRLGLQNSSLEAKWECLLNNELFTDITFIVGENKEPVKCHRLVLKMQSKHFEDILPPDKDSLEVPSCDVSVFRKMLKYLYTDKLEVTAEEAMDTLLLAKRYHLTNLQTKCGRIVLEGITVNNAAALLKKADEIGDKHLSTRVLEFIVQNASQVIFTDGFKEIKISSIVKLLETSHRYWNVEEVQILEAVRGWAAAECKRQGKSEEGPSLQEVASEAFKLIDFKKFTALEFTTRVAKLELLPYKTMLEIQSSLIEREQNMRTVNFSPFSLDESGPPLSPGSGSISSSSHDEHHGETIETPASPKPQKSPKKVELNSNPVEIPGDYVEEVSYGTVYKLVRYTCPIEEDWKADSDKYKISFSCSLPINIIGVSLYGQANDVKAKFTDVRVKILSYDEGTKYADFIEKSVLPEKGGEFDVMFPKSVCIKKAEWYTIVVGVNSRVKPYGTGGRKNYSVALGEGQAKVEFNFRNSDGIKGASHARGQLPKIHFTVADN